MQAFILLQSWYLVTPGLVLVVVLSGSPFLGPLVLQKNSDNVVMFIPRRGTRILPQICTVVSALLLPCHCIPTLPWLVPVWPCPLELSKVMEAEAYSQKKQETGTWKGLCAQEPNRVLLSFKYPLNEVDDLRDILKTKGESASDWLNMGIEGETGIKQDDWISPEFSFITSHLPFWLSLLHLINDYKLNTELRYFHRAFHSLYFLL